MHNMQLIELEPKLVQSNENSSLFNKLPLFENAKKEIENLRPSLAVLGDIICQNGLENDIGVTLLHRHFKVQSNEVVTKTVFDDYATVAPIQGADKTAGYIFAATEDTFHPMEFISSNGHYYETVKSKQKLLQECSELNQALHDLGVSDKLGLFIRHQPFEENGMAWVEDSNQNRQLLISKRELSEDLLKSTTETNWYFTIQDNKNSSETGVFCGICCAIHCGIHCGWHD